MRPFDFTDNRIPLDARLEVMLKAQNGDDVPFLVAAVRHFRSVAAGVVEAFDDASAEKYDELQLQKFCELGGVEPLRAIISSPPASPAPPSPEQTHPFLPSPAPDPRTAS